MCRTKLTWREPWLTVVQAQYVDGYRLRLDFDNGERGVVDLADTLWGPMFEPLRDVEAFRRFTVSDVLHTVAWANGADLAPEYLYAKLREQAAPATVSPTNGGAS